MLAGPSFFWLLPFGILLVSIALAPLIFREHWERYYYWVCLSLSAIVCGYYAFFRRDVARVEHALSEYGSFIVVVGSLYTVAGGIHLRARDHCTPAVNTMFLLLGALLANVVGTIGASILLIRPWIEMNKTRFTGFHLAFFIFLVSNIGGSLLPVGPPLLLGYENGVPFLWPLLQMWRPWSVVMLVLLSVFYCIDRRRFHSVEVRAKPSSVGRERERWRIFGKRNVVLMAILLVALAFLTSPRREIVMLATALTSYFATPRRLHQANAFTFLPLKEVAALFFGIFATLIPVLDLVQSHARDVGLGTPVGFFWVTGVLSAFLDNAPAYLTFFTQALASHGGSLDRAGDVAAFLRAHGDLLVGISLGATFFGACTYIGNGPNLLVKAVADSLKMPTPGFFGFLLKYSLPVLLPLFVLITVLFLRG